MRVWITWRDEKMNKNVELGFTFELNNYAPEKLWDDIKQLVEERLKDENV